MEQVVDVVRQAAAILTKERSLSASHFAILPA